MLPLSSSSFELCQVLLLSATRRKARSSILGSPPSFSTALNTLFSCKADNSDDNVARRLCDLNREIEKLNHGKPINVKSPKQVSTAIFGRSQTATKTILMKVASVENDSESEYAELPNEKRVLAKLILEYRALARDTNVNGNADSTRNEYTAIKESNQNLNGKYGSKPIVDSSTAYQRNQPQSRQISDEEVVKSLFASPNSKIDPYWKEPLLQLSKSTARALLNQLDPSLCPMGYDPSAVPRRTMRKTAAPSTAGKKGSFLSYCRLQKEEYPQCILLVRCGDFYETFGLDAILLVEHLGLNSMAGKARAGCPYRNIQATLNGLTQQGFSVAVFEEMGTVANNKIKSRFLSQIVSPASPTYLYDNWLLGGGENDPQHGSLEGLPPSRPCMGIVQTAAGYSLVEVSLEERCVQYSERLTPEAVACRLAAYPPADPLIYIPSQADATSSSLSSLPFLPNAKVPAGLDGSETVVESSMGGFRIRTKIIPPQLIQKPSEGTSDADRHINAIVQKVIDLNEAHFDRPTGQDAPTRRPTVDDFLISLPRTATNPLYYETASQLGLLKTPSIPQLTNFVLDDAAPASARRFLQRYLLIPPPPEIAKSMSELVGSLMDPYASPLPPLVVPPLGKVLSLVRVGQASANIYGDVLQSLSTPQLLFASENTPLPVEALLTLCAHESGLPCSRTSLVERCRKATDIIEAVVSPVFHVASADAEGGGSDDALTDDKYVSNSFFERNESPWRGRVQPQVAKDAYEEVEAAAERFRDAVKSDFIGDNDANKAFIIHDFYNNLIALKKIPNVGLKEGHYFHPRDRNGKTIRNRYTTEKVQGALSDYVSACEGACESVSSVLSKLAQEIEEQGHIPAIVQAAHLNLVLSTAYHHAVKASKLKWNLATVVEDGGDDREMHLVNVWPYWMDHSQAVPNTFDLNGLFLLTAPNMSGKSTLMRSTAAAALLSVCGFCAPLGADSIIPRFDTLFVRGASADVPTEDKSAFGAEMGDIAALMRCCGPKSLIFVDELGRGTSPRDGTRLAGAVLEAMAQRGMTGIFATHLHDILELPLDRRDRIINKRLAIEQQGGSYEWKYLLEDGVCKDSLALVTAARFGLPEEIIRRAEDLAKYIPEVGKLRNEADSSQRNEVSPSGRSKGTDTASQYKQDTLEDQQQRELDFQRAVSLAEDLTGQASIPIPPRWNPPPALCNNQSCVYMIQLTANPPKYYVGETDALSQRLKKHRSKGEPWSTSRAVALPVADKSEARAWESRLIQKLAQGGFRMESISDGRTLRHL